MSRAREHDRGEPMNTKTIRPLPAAIPIFVLLVSAATVAACGTPPSEAPQQSATPAPPAAAPPAAQADPHWDYGHEVGPAAWGGLSPKYAMCGEGRSQSPIDITTSTPTALPELRAQYRPASLHIVHHEHKADVVNTGHSIQVNYPEADTLAVGAETFTLVQYHFHSPSEHTVNDEHFPMEMHLVHKSADGKLAVVGVFIEEGAQNAAFDPVWANLPREKGVEQHYEDIEVDVNQLLPARRATYRYDGSLTTPPCSEGVKWFVITTPIQLSASQIGEFREILTGNNRPVQPLNGRIVMVDTMTGKPGP